jgi:hypothetical protein
MSYDLMFRYDSFNFQHLISSRPLLMIAGMDAQTLHYSRTAVENAKEPKEFLEVHRKTHFDLWDDLTKTRPKPVDFSTIITVVFDCGIDCGRCKCASRHFEAPLVFQHK